MAKSLQSISDYSNFDKIIIISDSKGRYLQNEKVHLEIENIEIEIYAVSGRRSIPALTELNAKILQERERCMATGSKTFFLFWHFMCDASN